MQSGTINLNDLFTHEKWILIAHIQGQLKIQWIEDSIANAKFQLGIGEFHCHKSIANGKVKLGKRNWNYQD